MSIQITAVNIALNKPHQLDGYSGQHVRRAIADGAEAGKFENASTNRTAPVT